MYLETFVLLTTLGAGLWLLGHLFEYHGVAAIGAVIVLAVGGTATITQVSVQDGEQIEREFTTIDNETVANETVVSQTRQPVAISEAFGGPIHSFTLGGLLMIAGGLLLVQDLNDIGG